MNFVGFHRAYCRYIVAMVFYNDRIIISLGIPVGLKEVPMERRMSALGGVTINKKVEQAYNSFSSFVSSLKNNL